MNPALQLDREAFIEHKRSEHHYYPPYFKRMEDLNLRGAPLLGRLPTPAPLTADAFEAAMRDGMVAIDVRSPEAFADAFVPESYSLPLPMVPAFAGWLLPPDAPIGIIAEDHESIEPAVRHFVRIGYDSVTAFLAGGLHSWETAGKPFERILAVHIEEVMERLQSNGRFTLLDVRRREEYESGHLPGAVHVYVGELPGRLESVPKDRPVTTFCGSGRRAMIAASVLRRAGYEQVEDCLGSMSACKAVGCEIVSDTP